jgi:hypothetical protein
VISPNGITNSVRNSPKKIYSFCAPVGSERRDKTSTPGIVLLLYSLSPSVHGMVDQSLISEERDGRGHPWLAGMSRACGGAWRRISRALLLLPLEFTTKREAVGIKPAASFNYVCPLLSSVTCDLLLCILLTQD